MKIFTMGMLGSDGGQAESLCDLSFLAPGIDSASIQECHQIALHAICNCFEPNP
jgi:D-sedoheptulose 7-phosphate isomerase